MHNGILDLRVKKESIVTKAIKFIKRRHYKAQADYFMKAADVERCKVGEALRNAAYYEKEALMAKAQAAGFN